MNPYENLQKGYLRIIRDVLIEEKDKYLKMILTNNYKDKKQEEYAKQVILEIEKISLNVTKALQTKLTRSSSDFISFQLEELMNLYRILAASRDSKKDKAKAGEQTVGRSYHHINTVLEPIKLAIQKKKKAAEIRQHVGEKGLASDGKTEIKIIAWKNDNNISVEFPDGRILEKQTYKKFRHGKIETHLDYILRKRNRGNYKVYEESDE